MAFNVKKAPLPLWKVLSIFLPPLCFIALPMLFLSRYPEHLAISNSVVTPFICLYFISWLIPESSQQKNTWKKVLFISLIIISSESLIFLLSYQFSLYAFFLPKTYSALITAPHLSLTTWTGLWSYFACTLFLQHLSQYELGKAPLSAGLLFTFKNTYVDAAVKRGFAITELCLRFAGIYLIVISALFTIIYKLQPSLLQHFYFSSLFFLILSVWMSGKIRLPLFQFIFKKMNLSNRAYIFLACGYFWLGLWASHHFSSKNTPTEASSYETNSINLSLFVTAFILLTPFITSLIAKHAKHAPRKTLLFLSFIFPNLFYINMYHTNLSWPFLTSPFAFVFLSLGFILFFFKNKTTSDYIVGKLRFPKQRIFIPTASYYLFPAGCLILFNFYCLGSLLEINSICALSLLIALFSCCVNALGMLSVFGIQYRKLSTTSNEHDALPEFAKNNLNT